MLPLGVLFAISKVAGPKPLRWLLNIYTWAWRGTPLLLQLMIVKFGLPYLGINIPEFYGATLVFALNTSACLLYTSYTIPYLYGNQSTTISMRYIIQTSTLS